MREFRIYDNNGYLDAVRQLIASVTPTMPKPPHVRFKDFKTFPASSSPLAEPGGDHDVYSVNYGSSDVFDCDSGRKIIPGD